ncbi:MAG: glycine hydroxymethyltransferase [Chlamydiota bacterium]
MSPLNNYLQNTPQAERSLPTIAYLASLEHISTVNPTVSDHIIKELDDQRSHLKLIASENYSSLAVQLAMGNLLTDKYAEGYVNHRFYAGCGNIDAVEAEGTRLLKELFGSEHAYIQPHSGCDANLVALWSILVQRVQNPKIEALGKSMDKLTPEEYEEVRRVMNKQKLMGLSLNSGGHLTHGYRHNISSKMMQSVPYEVDPQTGILDYAALAEQVRREKPTILLAGYSAYPRLINFAKMREIADSVGAVLMSDIAHFAGLVAGKALTGEYNPVPYSHIVTSTTHKTMRGPRGGFILCTEEFRDTVNKGCPLVLGGPLPNMIAAKAVAFQEASQPSFREYASKILDNSQELAQELLRRGAKLFTGGTENHLVVVDTSSFGISGRQAEQALRDANLTVNRNSIPNDPNGPWYTSGIRIGTPAVTSRGLGSDEMKEIADIIVEVLTNTSVANSPKTGKPSKALYTLDPKVKEASQHRVEEILGKFPLYPELMLANS